MSSTFQNDMAREGFYGIEGVHVEVILLVTRSPNHLMMTYFHAISC